MMGEGEVLTHLAAVRRAVEFCREVQARAREEGKARELFVMFMPLAMRFGYTVERPAPQLTYFVVPAEATEENPNMTPLYHSGSDVLSSAWIGDVK